MDFKDRIIIKQGDITDLDVDVIVNAANTDLILGSGVAGAIRKKGGESIQRECDEIGSIPLGESAITDGGNLKAKYVIHAAGMHLEGRVLDQALRDSTRNSLKRANEKGLKTIAFPAIGTGVGGFPLDKSAEIMIDTVSEFLKHNETSIEMVYFVLFDEESFEAFDNYLKKKIAHGI